MRNYCIIHQLHIEILLIFKTSDTDEPDDDDQLRYLQDALRKLAVKNAQLWTASKIYYSYLSLAALFEIVSTRSTTPDTRERETIRLKVPIVACIVAYAFTF